MNRPYSQHILSLIWLWRTHKIVVAARNSALMFLPLLRLKDAKFQWGGKTYAAKIQLSYRAITLITYLILSRWGGMCSFTGVTERVMFLLTKICCALATLGQLRSNLSTSDLTQFLIVQVLLCSWPVVCLCTNSWILRCSHPQCAL